MATEAHSSGANESGACWKAQQVVDGLVRVLVVGLERLRRCRHWLDEETDDASSLFILASTRISHKRRHAFLTFHSLP